MHGTEEYHSPRILLVLAFAVVDVAKEEMKTAPEAFEAAPLLPDDTICPCFGEACLGPHWSAPSVLDTGPGMYEHCWSPVEATTENSYCCKKCLPLEFLSVP